MSSFPVFTISYRVDGRRCIDNFSWVAFDPYKFCRIKKCERFVVYHRAHPVYEFVFPYGYVNILEHYSKGFCDPDSCDNLF